MKKIIIFGGIGLVAYLLYKNRKKTQTEVKLPEIKKVITDSQPTSGGIDVLSNPTGIVINKYQNEGCVKMGKL